jgi:hypothetical protein
LRKEDIWESERFKLLLLYHREKASGAVLIGFEVIAAVIMKNVVFWVLMPCSSEKDRRFARHITAIIRVKE